MRFERIFCMPNKNTFQMKPLLDLAQKYIRDEDRWLNPFARDCQLVNHTNDLNPDTKAEYHLDFKEFLDMFEFGQWEGMIIDPPFTPTQIKRSYNSIGLDPSNTDTQGFYWDAWRHVLRILPKYVIQCGYHSNGKIDHYQLIELLIMNHGGNHHDTIVTVWKRKNHSLEEFI